MTELPLAAEFPTPVRADWEALVDKVLKGAPFRRLVHTGFDGLETQPLSTADDVATLHDESGFPGAAPFTRGSSPAPLPHGQWEIRSTVALADPAAANSMALEELFNGASGLTMRFDRAFRRGFGPESDVFDELGAVDGVCLHTVDALDRALAEVYLDVAPVTLQPGASFTQAAAWMREIWTRRGVGGAEVLGCLGADPIATLVTEGIVANGIERSLVELGHLGATTAGATPLVRTAMVDVGPFVEAGADIVEQLALALSTGVAYLRAMEASGLDVDTAASQIEFTLVLDAEFFEGIASVRAFRRTWAEVLTASGAPDAGRHTRVTVRTAARMMTRRDPWVNLLRVTSACFAAAVGGAQAVVALPFDSECGLPDGLGLRMARTTQLLLAEESHVAEIVDPAGGSWSLEALTDSYAEAAWSNFAELEGAGGVIGGLLDGSIASGLAESWERRRRAFATRKAPICGVSEFPFLDEAPVIRRARDADAPAVRAAARVVGGDAEHVRGTATMIEPLPAHRAAAEFEALRDASDAHLAATGGRPTIFLATLGPVAEHTARVTWAKNFYEAGGIATIVGGSFADSGSAIACLCSSDAVYAEQAETAAAELKVAGAREVHLAGQPGDRRGADIAAGVDEFIHVGVDVIDILTRTHTSLGVTR